MVTPCWLKIVPEWLNKGAALTKVMRECGIRPEEAAAFGNGENDLGMLKSVTHSYAMGNAFDSRYWNKSPCTPPEHGGRRGKNNL